MSVYILNDKFEVIESDADALEAGRWLAAVERREVAKTVNLAFRARQDRPQTTSCSTVFTVIGYPSDDDRPYVFETLVESEWESLDGMQDRYRTLAEAIEGHEAMCARIWREDAPETRWGSLAIRFTAAQAPKPPPGPSAWERLLKN